MFYPHHQLCGAILSTSGSSAKVKSKKGSVFYYMYQLSHVLISWVFISIFNHAKQEEIQILIKSSKDIIGSSYGFIDWTIVLMSATQDNISQHENW